jgi:cell division septal protein FtsQ
VLEKARQFFQYYSEIYNNNEQEVSYVDLRYTNGFVIGWQGVNETEIKNGQKKNG